MRNEALLSLRNARRLSREPTERRFTLLNSVKRQIKQYAAATVEQYSFNRPEICRPEHAPAAEQEDIIQSRINQKEDDIDRLSVGIGGRNDPIVVRTWDNNV